MEQRKNENTRDTASELLEARWSVISFEKLEAAGLTYAGARQKMDELEKRRVAGVCIVTDEAAQRVGSGQSAVAVEGGKF